MIATLAHSIYRSSIKIPLKSATKSANFRSYFNFPQQTGIITNSRPYISAPNSVWYPSWLERVSEQMVGVDMFSKLLKERIVFVDGPIDDKSAAVTVAQLLLLQQEDPKSPIRMYINSPGGHVTAGMAIYDTMQYVTAPVSTVCIGQACSMASLLLAAGTPGLRRSLPHSWIMVHQPSSGTQGQASDMEIAAKHILRIKSVLSGLYHKHTGQTADRIERDLDRDTWLSAEEAKAWGLIDEVILPPPKPHMTAEAEQMLREERAAQNPPKPPTNPSL